MVRNLNALGQALVCVFAMSAIAASVASADALTAESYPATVTGASDPGAAVATFTTTSGTVKCPDTSYSGTLAAATTTLTMSANFNGSKDTCSSLGGAVPTLAEMNGCDYLFHIGTGSSTTGTFDITCPAGKEITVRSNENTAGTLTTKCTIHIPPQSNIGGLTFDNTGVGATKEIRITINATGITYTHKSGSGLGACAGGVQQHSANFTGTYLLTGEADGGSSHIGLFLTESTV